MKKCDYRGEQEKCPNYRPKCEVVGKVDLTCLNFRKDHLGENGGSICDGEFYKK
jgi:hypothetical protein